MHSEAMCRSALCIFINGCKSDLSRRRLKRQPFSFFLLTGIFFSLLAVYIGKCLFLFYHFIDNSPVGNTADIPVVYKQIGFQFSGKALMISFFFRIVFIGCIKLQSSGSAPFYGFVQKFSLAYTPQD